MSVIRIRGSDLYQWDTGREIEIYPYNSLKVDEVHFKNPDSNEDLKAIFRNSENVIIAEIPNVLLRNTNNITIYVMMSTDLGIRTVKECTFGINARQKPADYILPEIKYINDANAFLRRITTGEFPETTGLEYERMKATETGLAESKEALILKGAEITEPFGVNDIPSAILTFETAEEFKKLYEDEKSRADEATERAKTAEAEVHRLESELEPLAKNEQQWIGLIENTLENLIIPQGVETIGNYAFYGKTSIKTINFSTSVKSLGMEAFCQCRGLTNLIITETITTIGHLCFGYCYGLTSMSLPKSLKTVNSNSFSGCNNLTNVSLAEGFNCNNLNLSSSTNYTADMIMSWAAAFIGGTPTNPITFIIGQENINKLSIDQQLVFMDKNINLM